MKKKILNYLRRLFCFQVYEFFIVSYNDKIHEVSDFISMPVYRIGPNSIKFTIKSSKEALELFNSITSEFNGLLVSYYGKTVNRARFSIWAFMMKMINI